MNIKEVFEKYHNIAVVGMSKNPAKPSNYVPVFMIDHGYNVIPVNPTAGEIADRISYPSLETVPDKIEIVNVFRRSEDALEVVKEAVERKKNRGDVNLIWLQEGIINEEAKKLAEENNIEFIQDACMMKEYNRFF